MAISVTNLIANGSPTDQSTPYTTASFNVVSGNLYLIAYKAQVAASPPAASFTTSGGETVIVDSRATAMYSTSIRMTLGYFVASSTGSRTVTATTAGVTLNKAIWSVEEVTGADTANPFLQVKTFATDTASGPTVTLDFPLANTASVTYGAIGVSQTAANTSVTGGTQLSETEIESVALSTAFRANNTAITWATTANIAGCAIVVELRDVAAVSLCNVLENGSATDATSHTTASFEAVSGRLYLIGWVNWIGAGTASTPTFTSSGGETVTRVVTGVNGVIAASAAWFVASSSGSRTVTGSYAGVTHVRAGWTVDDAINVNTTTPVVQSGSATNAGAASTNPLVTLSNAITTATNPTWGAVGSNTVPGSIAPTSTWIELGESAQIESNLVVASLYKINSTTASWATNSAAYRAVALEIDSVTAVNATATPAAIAVPVTLPSATLTATSTPLPAAIAVPVTVPQALASRSQTALPAAIAVPVTFPVPTLLAVATATPGVISVPVTLPTPTVLAAGNAVPAAIAVPITIPSVAVTATSIITPSPIAVPVTIPLATASGVGTGTALPDAITVTVSIPASTQTATSTPLPSPIAVPVTIPQASAGASHTALPDPIAVPVTLPSPDLFADSTTTPAPIQVPIAIPQAEATGVDGDATVTPNPILVSVTFPEVDAHAPPIPRASGGGAYRRSVKREAEYRIEIRYTAEAFAETVDWSYIEDEELELLLML